MTDLLGKICAAIATQEGFYAPNSLPGKLQNPGDLRAAPWLSNAKIEGGYWKADSIQQGIAGLYHQVALNVARGYTLRQLITAWAPATDGNDPKSYLNFVQVRCNIINPDEPLQNLLELPHA